MEAELPKRLAWERFSKASVSFVASDWLGYTKHPKLMSILSEDWRYKPTVARQMLAEFSIEQLDPGLADTDFATFLLRGPDFVQYFAYLLGLIAYSEVVRKSIDGRLKRSFRELMDENSYAFVTKRAAFCHPRLFAKFAPITSSDLDSDQMQVVGLWVLTVLFDRLGNSLKRRLNMMFSAAVVGGVRNHLEKQVVDENELATISKVVMRLIGEIGT